MTRFKDQVAVVTGGGRGIGKSVAERFAQEGAKVAVVSRTEANSQKVADEINAKFPGAARGYAVDVADFDSVQGVAEQILSDFGKVDILVNNAGVTRDTLAMRMSVEDWDAVIDTNLKGAFNFVRALVKSFVKQRGGRIINVSSVSGLRGEAGQLNYSASKAGLIGFTKSLARELAGRGITVNALAPGFTTTDMTSVLSDGIKETALTRIPMGRFGTVEEIAAGVAFLASPEASYVTGQTLVVDGGIGM